MTLQPMQSEVKCDYDSNQAAIWTDGKKYCFECYIKLTKERAKTKRE